MSRLTDLAERRQENLDVVATDAATRVVRLWSSANPAELERSWTYTAPEIAAVVAASQVDAARQSTAYAEATATAIGATPTRRTVVAEAFGGVTREGRAVAPELYSGVTYTKTLIGAGMGVGQAFRAGTALMSILAANTVRDAGRSADRVAGITQGQTRYVRVVQSGACSRCAILAGVQGYRVDFERHPGCRCTSIGIPAGGSVPEGFFASSGEYFDSLTEAEQDRIFTKSGAWAIRNGADEIKVVNARRGMYKSAVKHADGSYGPSRLRPITIGVRADGSPLQVYATTEGATWRSSWARQQADGVKGATDRYRRTSTLRLMPEQIMKMSGSAAPERARELLERYGYVR